MANPSSIVENDEISLQLAVDEEHIDEFEAILESRRFFVRFLRFLRGERSTPASVTSSSASW